MYSNPSASLQLTDASHVLLRSPGPPKSLLCAVVSYFCSLKFTPVSNAAEMAINLSISLLKAFRKHPYCSLNKILTLGHGLPEPSQADSCSNLIPLKSPAAFTPRPSLWYPSAPRAEPAMPSPSLWGTSASDLSALDLPVRTPGLGLSFSTCSPTIQAPAARCWPPLAG